MKAISIFLFVFINSITLNAQNHHEKQLVIDNDSIYSYLLYKHIEYLESHFSIRKALNDSVILVREDFPITRFIPDSIGNRKVILVNDSILDSISLSNQKNIIEIRPMFFLDNTINIVYKDLYLESNKNSFDIVVQGGSQFVFEFDCIRNEIVLKEIKH